MRPGLRSNEQPGQDDAASLPSQSYPSSDSEENYAPPSNRRGRQTRGAQRGGHTGSSVARVGRQKRTRTNDENELPPNDTDITMPDLTDEISLESGESVARPTLDNFHELGVQWGAVRAEEVLSSASIPKNNRPSATGVFEAQALQAAYQLDKTMLCIVLKCSRHVLDEALLEGPLAREPNAYTNYQKYSIPATTTQIPAKGVSEGFGERNTVVGNTWSTYLEDEQKVFSPELFERLCVTTSEAYALTQTPRGIPSVADQDTSKAPAQPKSSFKPLSNEEVTTYVPIFKRLVNLNKVSGDLHEGRLWRHSAKFRCRSREQLMKLEISKVARQLHVLKNQFNLQFHLLLACWNPDTSTTQALFQDEHTSCQRWVRQEKKVHLLERFSFEATKAPEHLRSTEQTLGTTKALSAGAQRQAEKRIPFLTRGVPGQSDAHPKVPKLKEGFARKTFRGGVKLTFHQTPDSLVSDEMIAKGPSRLSNEEVQLWLDDINFERYKIIKIATDSKRKRKDGLTEAEAALDDEETEPQEGLTN
ncbi:uncharacterized protein MELLADRAFT_62253 [Melampsora larici-populina 98AG31]|uniref:Uncharacterized protein n=1 Tax=Melampsora larici-populina (strain 98AG31 / pathotype 3-4-7) TaxID=747676 RepID=F4RI62_MELLP|nr:uncharacterized protein MELLADRAFT_62253 [Melampsora larici-populina 98AG31]EGG07946.1 hypothetical protein MELLADRAFT_62253 [Melampsora larici-populina 98AG31]